MLLPKATNSMKVLQEIPITVVLMYQVIICFVCFIFDLEFVYSSNELILYNRYYILYMIYNL